MGKRSELESGMQFSYCGEFDRLRRNGIFELYEIGTVQVDDQEWMAEPGSTWVRLRNVHSQLAISCSEQYLRNCFIPLGRDQ